MGLAIAGIVYIKDHRPDAPIARAGKVDKKERPRQRASPMPMAADPRARRAGSKSYAFYDMLPKFEVVVPEKDKDVRPDIKSVPETRRGTYVLQAGSYKNFADADRVRAQAGAAGRGIQSAEGVRRQRYLAPHPHRADLQAG